MTEQSEEEIHDEAQERSAPTGAVVYRAICEEGQSELDRSTSALFWSGLAAGLSMSFSFVASALLHAHTPNADWQRLVTSLGYPLGFIIVVLGRQQLFTENTLTVVLPFLSKPQADKLANIARVWLVVLLANTIGALIMSFVLARTQALEADTFEALRKIAEHTYAESFSVTLLRGVFAGWLIALMVWLLPFAESARVWVIGLVTYVVGLAHFSHIIAGSVDAAFLVWTGEHSWGAFFGQFYFPALLGNILGGVVLVAMINHAQVTAGEKGTDA